MNHSRSLFCVVLLEFCTHAAGAGQRGIKTKVYPDQLFPQVKLVTSKGIIVIELSRRRAPITATIFFVMSSAFAEWVAATAPLGQSIEINTAAQRRDQA